MKNIMGSQFQVMLGSLYRAASHDIPSKEGRIEFISMDLLLELANTTSLVDKFISVSLKLG